MVVCEFASFVKTFIIGGCVGAGLMLLAFAALATLGGKKKPPRP